MNEFDQLFVVQYKHYRVNVARNSYCYAVSKNWPVHKNFIKYYDQIYDDLHFYTDDHTHLRLVHIR